MLHLQKWKKVNKNCLSHFWLMFWAKSVIKLFVQQMTKARSIYTLFYGSIVSSLVDLVLQVFEDLH